MGIIYAHSWIFFILNSLLIPLGVFFITLPVVCCTFDKNLSKVVIEHKSLRTQQILEYPLTNIWQVDIKRYGQINRLVIVLMSQQEILIHEDYTNDKNLNQLVHDIKDFLEAKI